MSAFEILNTESSLCVCSAYGSPLFCSLDLSRKYRKEAKVQCCNLESKPGTPSVPRYAEASALERREKSKEVITPSCTTKCFPVFRVHPIKISVSSSTFLLVTHCQESVEFVDPFTHFEE